MAKLKSFIYDVEEQVNEHCDLENIITESDTCKEAQNKVVSIFKKEFSSFQIDIAKNYVAQSWSDYWGDYHVQ